MVAAVAAAAVAVTWCGGGCDGGVGGDPDQRCVRGCQVLTAILYLNPGWEAARDGGELRLLPFP